MSFGTYLLTALALMLIIEGLIYSLFTDQVRIMMVRVLTLPPGVLRGVGLAMIGIGVVLIGVLFQLAG